MTHVAPVASVTTVASVTSSLASRLSRTMVSSADAGRRVSGFRSGMRRRHVSGRRAAAAAAEQRRPAPWTADGLSRGTSKMVLYRARGGTAIQILLL